MKSPSLKQFAFVTGIKLPRSGDITGTLAGHRIIAFCNTWTRRKIQSVRLFPSPVAAKIPMRDTVNAGKWLAARIAFPVTVESRRMLFTASPNGSVERHPMRRVAGPVGKLP